MELFVNDKLDTWEYKYQIDEEYIGLDWVDINVKTEEDKYSKWVLLNKECRGLLIMLAKSSATEYILEEIVQESFIAFDELSKIMIMKKDNKEKVKSIYIDIIKKQICKKNRFDSDVHNMETYNRHYKNYSKIMIKCLIELKKQSTLEEDIIENVTKETRSDIIKKIMNKEEYDDLLLHYTLGKSTSSTISGLSSDAYYQKNRHKIKKYQRRVKAYEKDRER